jgi:mono/diheme cytochrome c family protein
MNRKTVYRILGGLGIILVLAIASALAYIIFARPNVDLKDIRVEVTKDRVERGRYLANHVTVCMDCHSTRDWSRFSGPPITGTEGKGGEKFDPSMGFPGVYYSPNITPYSLASWSDAEIYRAITSGVSKDGHPLFPVMPYTYYGTMATEDIYSIIAYIRSLSPIQYTAQVSEADVPMNIILHLIPKEANPGQIPPVSDTVKYGQYLVNASGCIECHSPVEKGQIIPGKAFTGGRLFTIPSGELRSPNLTPDMETGIGSWTADVFVKRFKDYDPAGYQAPVLPKGAFNTIMPWTMYAGMDTTDLRAIYAYLHSLEPVKNEVVLFKPMK